MKTWLSPKVKKALPSRLHGLGFFACADITRDEVVAVKNGHIMTRREIDELAITGQPELPIDADLFICPMTEEEKKESMLYINHSCEPNVGMRGDVCVIAMRNISADEELTIDYGMVYNGEYSMECLCGTDTCRKVITGNDYQLENVKRYGVYCSAYIQSIQN